VRLTHVRLLVKDFHAMLSFYRDTLGLRVGFDDGENFAEVKAGGVDLSLFVRHGMADAVDDLRSGEGDRAALIFQVDDVDATYRRLSSGAVRFVTPPKDMADWGIRVAIFRDPEGNLVEINQPLARG
jgi:lactoylglutathione lyase